MGSVVLRGVHKRFGGAAVIRGVDLEVEDGEFLVFVGPSGCGKSTLLRMIAGLESISEGELLIDGKRANEVAPAARGAAMVFQSYALYPHMTVAENLGFALKMAGVKRDERERQVARAAQTLRITEILARYPRELSGGQRQRVAIGRAIVRRPSVFLFDEPLSNLDAALRVNMRIELARLHQELRTTMIYVTHDQVEAMTLGRRIAVFNHGRIEQLGAPLALYESPANEFVASFLGAPRINLIARPVADATASHRKLWSELAHEGDPSTQRVGLRPEHLRLVLPGEAGAGVPARVQLVEQLGDCAIVHLQVDGLTETLVAKVGAGPLAAGTTVRLQPDPARAIGFDDQGRRLP